MTSTLTKSHIGVEDIKWIDGSTGTFTRKTTTGALITLNKIGEVINVKHPPFNAKGDGVTDDTNAIQNAINASAGNIVFLPPGNYLTTSQLLINTDGTILQGSGFGTTIHFKPTVAATCIKVYESVSGYLGNIVLRDFYIYSTVAYGDFTKVGISVTDITRSLIDNVPIVMYGNNASIALQTRGRDLTTIRKPWYYADIPISIENNPQYPTIDCDHFHFEDTLLVSIESAAGGPTIQIEDGVVVTNLTFDGYNAWIPKTHGLYWNDTIAGSNSVNLVFKNIRMEQTTDQTVYMFYINRSDTNIQNIIFENVDGGLKSKGYYLRRVRNATFLNCYYVNNVSNEALNVDSTVYSIGILNCFWQTDTTATMTGQYAMFQVKPLNTGSPLPSSGFYTTAPTYYSSSMDLYPLTDNTYYLGKHNDDTPFAWKGVNVKDTTNGKYYCIEVINGVLTATDLTD